jgi:uncharacterized HAD superfamily protein
MDEIINFKKNLKEKNIQGLALDIDETLSWTVGYWMEQMLINFGNPENLTPHELVKKYRYSQNVPYWQTPEGYKWIEEKRRDNSIQIDIPLIENANLVVQEINKIIPIVAYVTARPVVIKEGTQQWLKKHKFPDAPIIMAPDSIKIEGRSEWKARVMETLFPEVLGIIDDNPEFIDFLSKDYPGTIFLYDNYEYNSLVGNIIPCPNWDEVYKEVKKRFSKNKV